MAPSTLTSLCHTILLHTTPSTYLLILARTSIHFPRVGNTCGMAAAAMAHLAMRPINHILAQHALALAVPTSLLLCMLLL